MNSSRRIVRLLLMGSTLILLVSCTGAGQTSPPSGLPEQVKQLDEFAQLRDARIKQLSDMTVAELAGALQQDSERGREPWNSLAVAEVQRRGAEVAPGLAEFIKEHDRSSFLTLMAIRSVNKDVYARLEADLRIGILVDTLAKSTYFNAFGLPHLYWEDPANAIIEEGPAAEKDLFPLLTDNRPAPMWGEEQVLEFQAYQYRVADYALALIRAVRAEKEPVPQDPAARDDLIRQMTP